MKVEHEAELDRNEMSMFSWMKDSKKNTEVGELLGLEPVSLSVKRTRYDGLNMLNVKTMQTVS